MAKRELSSTLRNLKFMQRATQREEKVEKEEDVKPDGNFSSSGTIRKCVVIMEGDPHPGAVIGRMSFQSFNPSIDKLIEEAANPRRPDTSATCSSNPGGRMLFRENESSVGGADHSKIGQNSEANGDLKRKQPEVVSEQKNVQGRPQSSPSNSKGSFKQPKRENLNWGVLRPPKSGNKKVERN